MTRFPIFPDLSLSGKIENFVGVITVAESLQTSLIEHIEAGRKIILVCRIEETPGGKKIVAAQLEVGQ